MRVKQKKRKKYEPEEKVLLKHGVICLFVCLFVVLLYFVSVSVPYESLAFSFPGAATSLLRDLKYWK